MNTAFLDTWTESESGWGQRSDGCSIHLSKEHYKQYVEEYWDSMPDSVPDEYERPDSNLREVVISKNLFNKLSKSKNGIRIYNTDFRELKTKNEILFKD